MHDPVNGVDYLVDYYAALGVPRDEEIGNIKKALRKRRKGCHPDRVSDMNEKIVRAAERESLLLNEAGEVFRDAERRRAYDELLFSWTGPLSADGTPVVALAREGFSLSALLCGAHGDFDDAKADEIALRVSGFNRKTFDCFQAFAASPGGIPEAMRDAYVEQLKLRDAYLSCKESLAWRRLGVEGRFDDPRLDHAAHVRGRLSKLRAEASAQIDRRALACGAPRPWLADVSCAPAPDAGVADLRAAFADAVDRHIAAHAADFDAIATERAALLRARLDAEFRLRYFPPRPGMTGRAALCLNAGDLRLWFAIVCDVEGDHINVSDAPHLECCADPASATAHVPADWTIVFCDFIPDIDAESQLRHAAGRYFDDLKKFVSETER